MIIVGYSISKACLKNSFDYFLNTNKLLVLNNNWVYSNTKKNNIMNYLQVLCFENNEIKQIIT